MRLLILLMSAFLAALAGGGTVAHASNGSHIVASATELAPANEERVFARPQAEPAISPRKLAWVAVEHPQHPARTAPIYAGRLRL